MGLITGGITTLRVLVLRPPRAGRPGLDGHDERHRSERLRVFSNAEKTAGV